jgi:hypothetical protein
MKQQATYHDMKHDPSICRLKLQRGGSMVMVQNRSRGDQLQEGSNGISA